ncbi:MAG: protein-disulfide reductase DsbD domain-containing protein [Alphaproteobacteria bacterium]
MTRSAAALAAAATVLLGAAGAEAERGRWISQEIYDGEFVDARIVAATDGVGDLAAVPAGLQIRLPDGWKTYWRSPGDAGLPPIVDWTGSANVAEVGMDWPAPQRFTLFGLETFGYEHEVVLPLSVTPVRRGEPVALAGRLDLLVCSEICVPSTFDLALDIPAGPAGVDAAAANLIDRFAARVPGDGRGSGLTVEAVAVLRDGGGEVLRVRATAREPLTAPDIFVEAGPYFAFAAPRTSLADDDRALVADLAVTQTPDGAPTLRGLPVTLTVVDGDRALEWIGTVAAARRTGPPPVDARGFAAILALALLGGLLLNLMPCVLPVLSIKLLSVVGKGGQSPRRVRMSFLASAAGILASFLVLAVALLALKEAGGAVGWGIQFQQPLFLVAMVVVLTLFACNLLGIFEILLPSALGNAAARVGHGDSLSGHFVTGAFATLLATPCSAPFLGTAVGFALSRGAPEILSVFTALGIGLALPYLAVAALPRLATRLPRPGPWMVTLKRVLSIALALTAVWLLSVLAAQVTPLTAYVVGGLMAAIALLLWGRHRLDGGPRLASVAVAGVLALAAFVAPTQFDRPGLGAVVAAASTATAWVPFDQAQIDRRVAEGSVVFVDVTADWCISCQANKALVLSRGMVAERLGESAVVAMRADWTRPDDRIATFLASHGRYGIPFYVVYGPAMPDGMLLPEILTEGVVLTALAEAG